MRTLKYLAVFAMLVGGTAVAAPAQTPSLTANQQRLADRFQPLAQRAIAPAATRADREALVAFMRGEVLPYMAREGAVVYPLVDSIVGSDGYATLTAMFDQDAITQTVRDMETQVDARDAARFRASTHSLASLLDTYFRREALLVEPLLAGKLSETDVASRVSEPQSGK